MKHILSNSEKKSKVISRCQSHHERILLFEHTLANPLNSNLLQHLQQRLR
jgi:hypothetical protein